LKEASGLEIWKDGSFYALNIHVGRFEVIDRKNGKHSYVVRNDRTGAIVQVSDKNDKNWVAPWN
jgi:translation elongation factor EF-Ts